MCTFPYWVLWCQLGSTSPWGGKSSGGLIVQRLDLTSGLLQKQKGLGGTLKQLMVQVWSSGFQQYNMEFVLRTSQVGTHKIQMLTHCDVVSWWKVNKFTKKLNECNTMALSVSAFVYCLKSSSWIRITILNRRLLRKRIVQQCTSFVNDHSHQHDFRIVSWINVHPLNLSDKLHFHL